MVSEIDSLISLSNFSSLVYSNASDVLVMTVGEEKEIKESMSEKK